MLDWAEDEIWSSGETGLEPIQDERETPEASGAVPKLPTLSA